MLHLPDSPEEEWPKEKEEGSLSVTFAGCFCLGVKVPCRPGVKGSADAIGR